MNRAILKITTEMWEDIKNGNKDVEIRKLNKDYIQEGFIIKFISLDRGVMLGEKMVKSKKYWKPRSVINLIKHEPTKEFVKSNYSDEIRVIVFELGDVKLGKF